LNGGEGTQGLNSLGRRNTAGKKRKGRDDFHPRSGREGVSVRSQHPEEDIRKGKKGKVRPMGDEGGDNPLSRYPEQK